MKYFIYTIVIIVCVGLQLALFQQFPIFHSAPSIVLLLGLFIAAKHPGYEFVFFSALAGFVMDMILSVPVGSYMLGLIAIAGLVHLFFSSFITIRFDWKHVPVISLLGMLFVLLWVGAYSTLLRVIAVPVNTVDWHSITGRLLPQLVIALLAMYPVYWFSEFVARFIERFELRKKGVGL
jgi:cell shape-determining protein MreD